MPTLKCMHCEQIFEGEDAHYEMKEHLFESLVVEVKTEEDNDLIKQLLNKYDFIDRIDIQLYEDFDDDDMMTIHRKDGTSYRIVYRDKDVRILSPWEKEDQKTPFEKACLQIDRIESKISDVIRAVIQHVPEADIKFHSIRENTGTLGYGYDFVFTSNGVKHTHRLWNNGQTVQRFAEEIKAYYAKEINGELTKFNDQYTADGVNVNQWLFNNKDKIVTLKLK